eukprot:m.208236 g.208236  ORF g.208236 m.208236 type:complete len:548 (+) comp15038_c2_seq16:3920-5563(+)
MYAHRTYTTNIHHKLDISSTKQPTYVVHTQSTQSTQSTKHTRHSMAYWQPAHDVVQANWNLLRFIAEDFYAQESPTLAVIEQYKGALRITVAFLHQDVCPLSSLKGVVPPLALANFARSEAASGSVPSRAQRLHTWTADDFEPPAFLGHNTIVKCSHFETIALEWVDAASEALLARDFVRLACIVHWPALIENQGRRFFNTQLFCDLLTQLSTVKERSTILAAFFRGDHVNVVRGLGQAARQFRAYAGSLVLQGEPMRNHSYCFPWTNPPNEPVDLAATVESGGLEDIELTKVIAMLREGDWKAAAAVLSWPALAQPKQLFHWSILKLIAARVQNEGDMLRFANQVFNHHNLSIALQFPTLVRPYADALQKMVPIPVLPGCDVMYSVFGPHWREKELLHALRCLPNPAKQEELRALLVKPVSHDKRLQRIDVAITIRGSSRNDIIALRSLTAQGHPILVIAKFIKERSGYSLAPHDFNQEVIVEGPLCFHRSDRDVSKICFFGTLNGTLQQDLRAYLEQQLQSVRQQQTFKCFHFRKGERVCTDVVT